MRHPLRVWLRQAEPQTHRASLLPHPVNTLLNALVFLHIVAGFIGLAAFWVPVFAKKGGRAHVRFGRVYTWCAYVVTLTAVVVSLGRVASYRLDGIGITDRPDLYGFTCLLGYLGIATFASVRQAIRVVATRRAPEALRTPFHVALSWASIAGSVVAVAVALTAWSEVSPILLGMSPIGVIIGSNNLRVIRRPREHMAWFYSHLGSMLGGGIAFHTAFLVFGLGRFVSLEIPGVLAVLPWLLPTLIGIPAIVLWTRHYRRRFGQAATARAR